MLKINDTRSVVHNILLSLHGQYSTIKKVQLYISDVTLSVIKGIWKSFLKYCCSIGVFTVHAATTIP